MTPTDDTDEHRLGGYGIPAIPTLTNSVDSVNSVGEKIFPQNARNAQKLLAEKSLPQMSTDAHRCRRVWHPCHTHAAKFCVFCEFRGRTAHPKHLCKSVKSVGGHLSRRFCEFGVFCGRISHSRWRGYGKMPYPPKEKSVGGKRFPQNARNAQKLLAEKSLPQMSTDVGGYGIPAIPTLPAQRVQLCKSVKYVGEKIFPQNARNAQKLLAEKSLPQMARMFTDVGGYGIPAIPTLTNSVNSVGEQRT